MADVSTPCSAYLAMADDWALCAELYAGTAAMKAARDRWLPRYSAEEETDYQVRLTNTVLFPGFRRTVETMTGRVFRRPLDLIGEPAPEIQGWCGNDIDLNGRDFSVFGAEVFDAALQFGLSHVLVDHPEEDETGAPPARSNADLITDRVRPYWVHIKPQSLIGWRTERQRGRTILTEIRFRQTAIESDGEWGEKVVERIKVIRPTEWLLYEERATGKNGEEFEWLQVGGGAMRFVFDGQPTIPLVTVYTGRTGVLTARPPLMDLAELNLTHWRSSSRQRDILDVSRIPMWAYFGFQKDEIAGLQLGPRAAIVSGDPSARAEILEISGPGLAAGKADLDDLKAEMAALGTQLLVRPPGDQTATQSSINSAENSSQLARMAVGLRDSLELALQYTAAWRGLAKERSGQVQINGDFDWVPSDQGHLASLDAARDRGDLSRTAHQRELKRRQVLDYTFDPETNAAELAAEGRLA
jgi:hypothetical protein